MNFSPLKTHFVAWPGEEILEKTPLLVVDENAEIEIKNISQGSFAPLDGFMTARDYHLTVQEMRLESGAPWTLPVTLDVSEEDGKRLLKCERVVLKDRNGKALAFLYVEDVYRVDLVKDVPIIFGTSDSSHPGVARELSRGAYRLGGRIEAFEGEIDKSNHLDLSPNEVRKIIADRGWRTVVGFQTRNPPHRAHEYLQRVALEVCDGLFVQPLVGWKKPDDFSPRAVLQAYEKLISEFYPADRALLGTLRTPMRYAGPREAVFHAIIRRNFGCTHFIVGRDHAGVGSFYSKYAAHELSQKFSDLGISVLCLHGPYHCSKCSTIVTEKTCPHEPDRHTNVSGTEVRKMISANIRPPTEYMRPEISDILIELFQKNEAFCGDRKDNNL